MRIVTISRRFTLAGWRRVAHVVAFLGIVGLALTLPGSAAAKGFTRAVFVGSNGRWVEVHAKESVIDGLLSRRGTVERIRGGYVRLFFVGPGDFPANPARYYPEQECVALDWPAYERSCARINANLVRLLRPARSLPRFDVRPTILAGITYHGQFSGTITTAAALKTPVELALVRMGRSAPLPRSCYAFSGRWYGPAAAARPTHFLLSAAGIYANDRLYPLRRGVWEWFRLSVAAPIAPWSRPLSFGRLHGWGTGHSGNTCSAYVGPAARVGVPLESAAWIARGVRYRDDPTADPPNKTLRRLPPNAVIVWAVIYSNPGAGRQKPIRLALTAAKRFKCCEAAAVPGGEWELAGAGPGRAYSVIVRIYFGSRPTSAMRAQAQRALDQLHLPPPQ
jgi:hypothetical protein